jgi:U3 small nucleolar RNA-associated protein 19
MFNAEITKKIKKPPIVEPQVPRRIFFETEKASEGDDNLLLSLWGF